MNKRFVLFVSLFAAGFGIFAQDKPASPASMLSGTLTLGAGETNLLDSPYVSDIPGLSSSLSAASVSLKFGDGAAYSYLDLSEEEEVIMRSTRMGYEASVVFDAANLYTYVAATTKTSVNGDSSFYSLLQPMIDWYENYKGRFGMAASPYSTGSWPTDNYDSSASGRTRFIYGKTVEPMACVAWDSTKWYDAQKLVSEVKLKIEDAIDAISPDASSGKIVDQYAYAALPEAKRNLAQNELQAWTDFHAITDGTDSKATLSGPNVQSAYIKFTNIGGVLDARLDFAGTRLFNGSLVASSRMDQPATGPGLALALPVGLIPGFNLSAATSLVGGKASVIENYETKNSEAIKGEASWLGLKLKAGYSIIDFASATVSLLWPDLAQRPGTFAATVGAKVEDRGELAYQAELEGSFLGWQDRYDDSADDVTAYAAGFDGQLTAFGLTPRLSARYKSAGFWGQGGNDAEDRFAGVDLLGDFNCVKVKDGAAFDCGLAFDPAPFIGLSLGSIEGGYQALVYDLAGSQATLGEGFYAGLKLSLLDLADIPLSLKARVSNYENWGIYAGRYADWNKAPTAGLLTGISWTASLCWDPKKEISLSLEGSGRETGWRMDTERLVSLAAKATIKF
jgi:hypothetical protein